MHEMAIAQSIVEQALEVIDREGVQRVTTIRLRIGAMRAVVPECLDFSFGVLSEGTALQGAHVEVEEVPIRTRCPSCQAETEPEPGLAWICPECGSMDVEMISGQELMLQSMDVED